MRREGNHHTGAGDDGKRERDGENELFHQVLRVQQLELLQGSATAGCVGRAITTPVPPMTANAMARMSFFMTGS